MPGKIQSISMLNKVHAHTKSKSFYTEVMKCNLVKDPYNLEKNLNKSHHNENKDIEKTKILYQKIQQKRERNRSDTFYQKNQEMNDQRQSTTTTVQEKQKQNYHLASHYFPKSTHKVVKSFSSKLIDNINEILNTCKVPQRNSLLVQNKNCSHKKNNSTAPMNYLNSRNNSNRSNKQKTMYLNNTNQAEQSVSNVAQSPTKRQEMEQQFKLWGTSRIAVNSKGQNQDQLNKNSQINKLKNNNQKMIFKHFTEDNEPSQISTTKQPKGTVQINLFDKNLQINSKSIMQQPIKQQLDQSNEKKGHKTKEQITLQNFEDKLNSLVQKIQYLDKNYIEEQQKIYEELIQSNQENFMSKSILQKLSLIHQNNLVTLAQQSHTIKSLINENQQMKIQLNQYEEQQQLFTMKLQTSDENKYLNNEEISQYTKNTENQKQQERSGSTTNYNQTIYQDILNENKHIKQLFDTQTQKIKYFITKEKKMLNLLAIIKRRGINIEKIYREDCQRSKSQLNPKKDITNIFDNDESNKNSSSRNSHGITDYYANDQFYILKDNNQTISYFNRGNSQEPIHNKPNQISVDQYIKQNNSLIQKNEQTRCKSEIRESVKDISFYDNALQIYKEQDINRRIDLKQKLKIDLSKISQNNQQINSDKKFMGDTFAYYTSQKKVSYSTSSEDDYIGAMNSEIHQSSSILNDMKEKNSVNINNSEFKNDLSKLKQDNNIQDFHEEFLSRINEFSLSWRQAIMKENQKFSQFIQSVSQKV